SVSRTCGEGACSRWVAKRAQHSVGVSDLTHSLNDDGFAAEREQAPSPHDGPKFQPSPQNPNRTSILHKGQPTENNGSEECSSCISLTSPCSTPLPAVACARIWMLNTVAWVSSPAFVTAC